MSTPAQDRDLPAPHVGPDTAPFFAATGEGRLMIKTCRACGRPHFYPRPICPHCFSADTVWQDSRGEGEIYTFSVARRGVPVPFAIAYVRLDEGVTMMSNIVDCDLDAIRIGQRVRVVFKPSENDGPRVPMFTPA